MNRATIIGNVVRTPELRSTQNGIQVCSFTVAVNRRVREGQQPEADYFSVTAWRELGANCSRFLQKGKKVYVCGPVSVRTYQRNDGTAGASMEITAQDVEFLSPKVSDADYLPPVQQPAVDPQSGMQQVAMGDDELPF